MGFVLYYYCIVLHSILDVGGVRLVDEVASFTKANRDLSCTTIVLYYIAIVPSSAPMLVLLSERMYL